MTFATRRDQLGGRWPFAAIVVIFALSVLVLSSLQGVPFVSQYGGFLIGASWGALSAPRWARLGLPGWLRTIGPMVLLALLFTCVMLTPRTPVRPMLASALFALLHLPLIILKDKPEQQQHRSVDNTGATI